MRTGTAALLSTSLLIGFAGCSDNASDSRAGSAGRGASTSTSTSGSTNGSTSQPANVSHFPGSGTGSGGLSLAGADVCDAVVKTTNMQLVTPATTCMLATGTGQLAASLEQVLECVKGTDTIHLRLTFDPGFVDNTYGTTAIGWKRKRGHTMDKDLTHSDHAELTTTNGKGEIVARFKLDYISADASAPSGYASLGVRGGDGAMLVGDPKWIVQWTTSLSRNFNERGYTDYTVNSPETDAQYTPNPKAPEWDYRVVYEAWIDAAAFGDSGFGDATISSVHASPSKASNDTLKVKPGDCPCQPDDPKCAGTAGVGGKGADCGPDDPQCAGTAGVGGKGSDCGPDDPGCVGTGDGGHGGKGMDCGPDDPGCTGQGPVGGTGGKGTFCAPDDPMCFGTGTVAGAPGKPMKERCPPDQPGCSPE